MWPIYKRLLQRSNKPILVGPFTSEIGFESLYWVPFVQSLGIDPSRLIPITRGGAAVWYGAPHGIELYDLRDPKDVRIENMVQHARTGLLKQTRVTAFDRSLLKDAAKAAGLTSYHVLHPSWMYQTLAPFWEGRVGLDWILSRLTVEQTVNGVSQRAIANLRVLPLPETVKLPANFCAARFYFRSTFPHSQVTLDCARECLKQIAQNQPVVLLNPDVHADEHVDVPVKDIPNVFKLSDFMKTAPRDNLAIQSAVLAKSTGFVGTYGGLAQLALRLGKPSVSFYWDWKGTSLAHKHLSEALSLNTGIAFLTLRLTDIPLLKTVAPNLSFQTSSSQGGLQQSGTQQPAPQPSHEEGILS
jgi:hypothetical protein